MKPCLGVLVVASCVALTACEDSYDCAAGGCDAGSVQAAADAGSTSTVTRATVTTPLAIVDRRVAGGLAAVKVEMFAPVSVDAPAGLDRGDFLTPAQADVRLETLVRTTAALMGGRAAGEAVPFLRVDLSITNLDDGRKIQTNLVPVIRLGGGMAYGRQLALVASIGAAQSGYAVRITIKRPAFFGDPDVEQHSPGVVLEDDLAMAATGTLFGERATIVDGFFTLEELAGTSTGGATPGTGATTGSSSGGAGGYIPP